MMIMRVAVSFLSKDENEMNVEYLIEKLPKLEKAGVDTIQWDLMDGYYNPVNTIKYFHPESMKKIMACTKLGTEAHMMVVRPWIFVDKIKECASMFIFHMESCNSKNDMIKTINKIKSVGKKVGIALEPETPVDSVKDYLELLDLVLVMTVKTGYAGQSFIDVSEKIKQLVKYRNEKKLGFEIEADGGINDKTIEIVRSVGCDAVNSASFILKNDYSKAVKILKGSE